MRPCLEGRRLPRVDGSFWAGTPDSSSGKRYPDAGDDDVQPCRVRAGAAPRRRRRRRHPRPAVRHRCSTAPSSSRRASRAATSSPCATCPPAVSRAQVRAVDRPRDPATSPSATTCTRTTSAWTTPSAPTSSAPSASPAADAAGPSRTFEGYRRGDGRVGTRNYVGILTSVNCSASTARMIADQFRGRVLDDYPHVDGVVALTHDTGCGLVPASEGAQMLAAHPARLRRTTRTSPGCSCSGSAAR